LIRKLSNKLTVNRSYHPSITSLTYETSYTLFPHFMLFIHSKLCLNSNCPQLLEAIYRRFFFPKSPNGIIHVQFTGKPVFNSVLKTKTRDSGRLQYLVFSADSEVEGIFFNEIAQKRKQVFSLLLIGLWFVDI
jgi:hypothetical protein